MISAHQPTTWLPDDDLIQFLLISMPAELDYLTKVAHKLLRGKMYQIMLTKLTIFGIHFNPH